MMIFDGNITVEPSNNNTSILNLNFIIWIKLIFSKMNLEFGNLETKLFDSTKPIS